MAENAEPAGEQSATPDPRPQPRYGELAPPGWEWKPPADAAPLPHMRPSHPAQHPEAHHHPDAATPPTTSGRRLPPAWDRPTTIVLLIIGLFGVFFAVQTQSGLPQAIATIYEQQGLGGYTPAASVAGIIVAGQVIQLGLYAVAVGVSVLLLLRRRLAFWVPLTVGLIALLALFGIVLAVLLSDPTLVNRMQTTGIGG